MKGSVSADDEHRLSFHVAAIDLSSQAVTVRECLWNQHETAPVVWGAARTVREVDAVVP